MLHNVKANLLYKLFQIMNRRALGPNTLDAPMARQEEFLFTQLRRQAETGYGRKYDFAHVETVEQYRERVPLTKYDDYEPYYERLKQGETNLLFKDKLVAWLLTSGTTSAVKTIPLTDYTAFTSSSAAGVGASTGNLLCLLFGVQWCCEQLLEKGRDDEDQKARA